jgi:hypothetical protein
VNVSDVVADRGIEEVLHFTTNLGLIGILGHGAVLSRYRLPREKYVEHVYRPNAKVRKDGRWLDYVNLSISRLNWEFFDHSRRWHKDEAVWWCALAFAPHVLSYDGVVFATTNNIYPACRHGMGAEGLSSLFDDIVQGAYGVPLTRPVAFPKSWTTCHQAEVLVPERVKTHAIRRIIVANERHLDIASSQCEILLGSIPIDVDPDAFEPDSNLQSA